MEVKCLNQDGFGQASALLVDMGGDTLTYDGRTITTPRSGVDIDAEAARHLSEQFASIARQLEEK